MASFCASGDAALILSRMRECMPTAALFAGMVAVMLSGLVPVVTWTIGAVAPASVRVFPAMVKPVVLNVRPPAVIAVPRVTVPAVLPKTAMSLLALSQMDV